MKNVILALIILCLGPSLKAADPAVVIPKWLANQTNIQTWAADFRQVRTLKSLTQPLVSTGQVWFAAPRNFRWELGGDPPQTIAIRKDDLMLVAYPRLERVEKYEFSQMENNQWKDTLALLQTGFPRSREELNDQFEISSLSEIQQLYQLELIPRSAGARKMMPKIHLLLSTNNFTLAGTELFFVDGSSMRNEFYNVQTNVSISNQFDFQIPSGFKVIEPMKPK